MNLRDIFIIYLACGAPFGVYYFLQNRNRTETKLLWLKSLLRFIAWIPFALEVVARNSFFTKLYNNGFDKTSETDLRIELEIEEIKKTFERCVSGAAQGFSIYEFREAFDRYVGLSAEVRDDNKDISTAETELFRITNHGNKKLGEICLNRRNRKRLSFHQKIARRDFFETCKKLFDNSAAPQMLISKAVRLAQLLDDFEARQLFEKLSHETQQFQEKRNVRNPENEIWNSEKHKPLTDNKISTGLQALTTAANLSKKD